jgi:hypothetical protein
VVAIQDDGPDDAGAPMTEAEARRLFDRLIRLGTHRLELQRSDGRGWATVERSWLRIAPGTWEEG